MTEPSTLVSAIILAAGLSTRMGQPKMLLPWGEKTVIEQVVATILAAEVRQPIVVTGARHEEIQAVLAGYPVRIVFNPLFADGEMLHSIQAGVAVLDTACTAALIVLGDQPQLQAPTVREIILEFEAYPAPLIIPSYQMRRGHPWLVRKELWSEILAIRPPETLRDFVQHHADDIHYINVDTASILSDLDTLEEYQKYKPQMQDEA